MSSPLINATIQAALLSATSNILAQVMTAYRTDSPIRLETLPILQFILFTLLSCPPNFWWQDYLERRFPGYITTSSSSLSSSDVTINEKQDSSTIAAGRDGEKRETKKLHVRNTLIKLVLDQSVGAAVNTIAFIATMGSLRGQSRGEVFEAVARDFWPVTKAGLKVWPLVSALNFTVVPVQNRIVVASLVGVGWGVYLSLLAASA